MIDYFTFRLVDFQSIPFALPSIILYRHISDTLCRRIVFAVIIYVSDSPRTFQFNFIEPFSVSLLPLQHAKIASPASETSSFNPADLYPCSSACASQRDPCPTCISQGPTPASIQTLSSNANANQPSASIHLPRIPLRKIYSAFLDAARDRLIDDIAEASLKASARHRQIKRFKTGFVLGPMGEGTSTSEWGASWEQHAKTRSGFARTTLELY